MIAYCETSGKRGAAVPNVEQQAIGAAANGARQHAESLAVLARFRIL